MNKHLALILSCSVLAACVGTTDPVARGMQGGGGGAALGCATGALMTIWAGPLAVAGCEMGAMAGASMGGMMGVATATSPSPPILGVPVP